MNKPSSNLYFEDLFSNTSDLIQFVDMEGNIQDINPSWLKTLGYSLNDVSGKSIYRFLWEDDHENYKKYREECISSNQQVDLRISFKHHNGSKIIVEGHLKPFYQSGNLLHTRGVFKDLRYIEQQERAQKAQFLKISLFLENAPYSVVVINGAQEVIEWNTKAEQTFGFTKKEILNKPLSEFIIPLPFREAHIKGMQHFLSTGQGAVLNKTIEISAINKQNYEFPISLSISNILIDGEWFFISFIEDISQKKKQQEEQINQEIELTKIKQADQRNRDFLNIASHELKTPITSIKALAQLALRGLERNSVNQTADYLRKIDDSSDKLKTLIYDLLDISKIQAGKLIINKELIDYPGFVEQIVNTCQTIYPTHTLKIANSEPALLNIDAIRIEQVLINLISNAVKYSPEAPVIEISSRRKYDMIVTSVKDGGIGIEINKQQKVFDKFYQIDELSKTDNSGLGLGLFISTEIIKQHNGTIWVESNVDKGSTFYFALPAE